eukprot:2845964-Pleurochrysis_carterae.AAC.2
MHDSRNGSVLMPEQGPQQPPGDHPSACGLRARRPPVLRGHAACPAPASTGFPAFSPWPRAASPCATRSLRSHGLRRPRRPRRRPRAPPRPPCRNDGTRRPSATRTGSRQRAETQVCPTSPAKRTQTTHVEQWVRLEGGARYKRWPLGKPE